MSRGWRTGLAGLVSVLLLATGCSWPTSSSGSAGQNTSTGATPLGPSSGGQTTPGTTPAGSGELQPGPTTSFLPPAPGTTTTTAASALDYLNLLRSMAGLPSVTENASLVDGLTKHARYILANNSTGHSESSAAPGYTAEGAAAGPRANCFGSPYASASFRQALDCWILGPCHAAGLLDPRLASAAFGSAGRTSGGLQYAACLDVVSGLGAPASSVSLPVLWPGSGQTVGFTTASRDYPDPVASCPGYSHPCGMPLYVLLGGAAAVPSVTACSLSRNGTAVEVREFDETNYANPDATARSLARQILASRKMLVLLPREPLTPGARYDASVTVDGKTIAWSFTVSPDAIR